MTLRAWRTRAGICVMRSVPGGTPCIHCLGERLREAGFAPRGPVEVADDAGLQSLLDTDPADAHPLATQVLRIDGTRMVRHRLLALPGCRHCSPVQTLPTPSLPPDTLLDPLFGIGSWLQAVAPGDDDASLCHTLSGQVHTPANRHAISARGQGMTAARARLGHLGETVERYAAFRPDPARIVTARAAELPESALSGAALFGMDDGQRRAAGYVALDGRRRIGWLRGTRLADGAARWVPAASVFLSREWQLDEARFCALHSHGLAAHRSPAEATEHALYEMYERACMTRAWHCQDFGQRIDPSVLGTDARALVERVTQAGLQVVLMAMTEPPAVPAVMALIWGDHPPWFMIGAGADATLAAATDSALLEAASGWQALIRRPEPEPSRFRLRRTEDTKGHHRFYASADRAARVVATFLDGTKGTLDRADDTPVVEASALLRAGMPDAVVVDLTPPDCAACGFSVQRVLVPGLPVYAFGRVGTPNHFRRQAELPDAAMPHPFR